jgi:hypothetical protein
MPTISRAQRSAATPCSALRHPTFGVPPACADHPIREPRPARRACGWDHAHLGSHPPQRACGRDHASMGSHPARRACGRDRVPHRITFTTTGAPHHGPAYHAGTTGIQHHGRSYHTLHNGHLHDGAGTTGLPESRPTHHHHKRDATHAPRTPNGVAFSGRLECITSIDRNCPFLLLDAKIAPIQPLRWNAMLGAGAVIVYKKYTYGCILLRRMCITASIICCNGWGLSCPTRVTIKRRWAVNNLPGRA